VSAECERWAHAVSVAIGCVRNEKLAADLTELAAALRDGLLCLKPPQLI